MTTDITELAQSLKAAATNVKETAHIARYLKATIARQTFKELMTPDNILALVEALEKAQRYIEELREWNAGLAQESYEREQRIFELENQLKAAENNEIDARCRIAELEESHAQVIQSRDHYKRMTEEGLKKLAEARTVKLPDLRQIVSGDRYVWSDGVYNYSQDVKAELTAKGIKWEAE